MNVTYEFALEHLVGLINNYNETTPLTVLIDGRSASGKTTFAEKLSLLTGCPVIHTDDFYRPKNCNDEIEMSLYEGNFDLNRFESEVVQGIASLDVFEVGVFDCKRGLIASKVVYPVSKAYIIEGAYSHHPKLSFENSIKVFVSAKEEQRQMRIMIRNGEEALERFKTLWMPAEERYIQHYDIQIKSDICIDTTCEV